MVRAAIVQFKEMGLEPLIYRVGYMASQREVNKIGYYSTSPNNQYDYENSNKSRNKRQQTHVHEYQGSTMFAEEDEDRHNHRFAGVTGEAIRRGNSHVHKLATNTDFLDHHHEICDTTGPAIDVGD